MARKSKGHVRPAAATGKLPMHIRNPDWEQNTLDQVPAPGSEVRAFRYEHDGTSYEITLTQRTKVLRSMPFDGAIWPAVVRSEEVESFTLTLWGYNHTDITHDPSVGRSYQWDDGDHIHGSDFAVKMGLNMADADAILLLLRSLDHSVKLRREVIHG